MISKKARSAPFNKTSTSEIKSADIFHGLLDRGFVKGNVNVLDKVPNSDGFLTITDSENYPVGEINVQLKTLRKKNILNPKHQCEISLLTYATESILPVILVAVDQINNKAYWLHLNKEVISKVEPHVKGNSISLSLPLENQIDSTLTYVGKWTEIVKTVQDKVQNFDLIKSQLITLKAQLGEVSKRLQPAYSLNELAIREIHIFLDYYNGLLDREFKAIKSLLYHNYWKIGIGIIEYTINSSRFILVPQALSNNSPLIKELIHVKESIIEELFVIDGAIVMMMNSETNSIKDNPERVAFGLIKRDVFKVVGKVNFPIDHSTIASEYLFNFVDTFSAYFGLQEQPESFRTDWLKELVLITLPHSTATTMNFAEHLTDFKYNLDSFKDRRYNKSFLENIKKAEQEVKGGVRPKVSVQLTSSIFDINLVYYYLELLKTRSIWTVDRLFLPMKNSNYGHFVWQSWIKENVDINLRSFFKNFHEIYDLFIADKFPYLSKELDLFDRCDTIVYVLRYGDGYQQQPTLEYFKLKALTPIQKSIIYYNMDDVSCPINAKSVYQNGWENRKIDGINYNVTELGGQNLDFLFSKTPIYALINEIIKKKFDKYFKEYESV